MMLMRSICFVCVCVFEKEKGKISGFVWVLVWLLKSEHETKTWMQVVIWREFMKQI